MRIIDKNTDFYDYWQGIYRDDSITFDRTDSFVLTKELMCEHLRTGPRWYNRLNPYRFLLLQVCNRFWLFFIEITKQIDYDIPKDYSIELITTWENHGKKRCLEKLDIVRFDWNVDRMISEYTGEGVWVYDRKKIRNRSDVLVQAIDTNNYDTMRTIDKHTIYKGGASYKFEDMKIEKHIPLLKACGIANCIDPLEIYLAFEEYFMLEKSSAERTESVGLTDKEKISNHGFDTTVSFRGKQ